MQKNYRQLTDKLFLTWANYLPEEGAIINGAILQGNTTTVVWDTLSKPEDLYFIDDFIPNNNQRVIAVYSHADWDHCWGTDAFPFDSIMAHADADERFANEMPSVLKRYRKRHEDFFANVILEPPDFVFDRPVVLDLGEKTLELIPAPGHTSDSLFGFCPEEGVLLVGDAVETVPEVTDPALIPPWISMLREWALDERVKVVIPGHGDVSDRSSLTQTADYLSDLAKGKLISMTKASASDRSKHRANVKKIKKSGTA